MVSRFIIIIIIIIITVLDKYLLQRPKLRKLCYQMETFKKNQFI